MTHPSFDDERMQRIYEDFAAQLRKAYQDAGEELPPGLATPEFIRSLVEDSYRLSQTEEAKRTRAALEAEITPIREAVAAALPGGVANPRFNDVFVERLKAWAERRPNPFPPPASA